MDDIPLAPTQAGAVDARLRTVLWRELAQAGDKETSKEWHRRLLQSGLLIEGGKAAADQDVRAGDPRPDIARLHRQMHELMTLEAHHAEVNQPGPWNSGAVRIGATSVLILLGLLYLTGIRHHGPVGTASLLCLVAVAAMWFDIWRRGQEARKTWVARTAVRDRLHASVIRLGARSWVAPLGREVIENTPHLDLLGMWKREVLQHLAPWQAKLDALAPLEDIEGLPAELIDDARPEVDPREEAECRTRITALSTVLQRLDLLESGLRETLEAHRKVAATGALPELGGLGFDLDEVRGLLRSVDIDPAKSGESAQRWLDRAESLTVSGGGARGR